MPQQTLWIVGYYQRGNYGDDLLQEAARHLLGRNHRLRFLNDVDLSALVAGACALDLHEPQSVVLFGGEVLTPYFLDRLVLLVEKMRSVRHTMPSIQAVGVSSNIPYLRLAPYLNLFDRVIARNEQDAAFVALRCSRNRHLLQVSDWENSNSGAPRVCTELPDACTADPVFLLPYLFRRGNQPSELEPRTLLALPCASHETAAEREAWQSLLSGCVGAGFRILFGAFSTDENQDDRHSIERLLHGASPEVRRQMQVAPSATSLSFRHCAGVITARFHGAVLAISQGKPFVTHVRFKV
jgi:hypothetical protein